MLKMSVRVGEGNRKKDDGTLLVRIIILTQSNASRMEEWHFPLRNSRNLFHVIDLAPKDEARKCTLMGLNKESSLSGSEGNCLEVRKM